MIIAYTGELCQFAETQSAPACLLDKAGARGIEYEYIGIRDYITFPRILSILPPFRAVFVLFPVFCTENLSVAVVFLRTKEKVLKFNDFSTILGADGGT